MTGIERYNIKTMGAASVILVLFVCLFSYVSAPESSGFFEAINPLQALMGAMFTLGYFGVPVVASAVTLLLFLAIIWFILFIIARHILK